jgi:hypothetical protein
VSTAAQRRQDWQRDRQRISQILRLNGSDESTDAMQTIEWARAFAQRESDPRLRDAAARAHLEAIHQQARRLAGALRAVPQELSQANVLPPQAAIDVVALMTPLPAQLSVTGRLREVEKLERECAEALRALPKTGRKQKQSWRAAVTRQLGALYRQRTGRPAATTPHSEFHELVTLVLGRSDPFRALRGRRR